MAHKTSLSSVVSNLVRAQMGSSLPANTLDDELDRRVADLILKEARQKEARYAQTGSYTSQTSSSGSAARPNKRFLASIIKSTDEHNKNVLRTQAESANEIKQQREQEDREERMRRAREAVSARSESFKEPRKSGGRDGDGYSSRSRRKRSRSKDSEDGHSSSRRDSKRHYDSGEEDDAYRQRKRRKNEDSRERRSPSPRSHSHRRREQSRDRDEDHARHSPRKPEERRKEDRKEGDRRRGHDKSRSQSPKRRNPRDDEDGGSKSTHRHRSSSARNDKEMRISSSRERDRHRTHKAPDKSRPSSRLLTVALDQSRNRSRDTSASVNDTPNVSNLSSNNLSNSPRLRASTAEMESKAASRRVRTNEGLPDSGNDIGPQPLRHRTPDRGSNSVNAQADKQNNHTEDEDEEDNSDLPQYSSKMDRYFKKSYDPRLDVAPTVIPSDGLIPADAFDNWNYMLEIVKKRREEKEERKRLEKLHGKDSKGSKSKKGKKKDVQTEGLTAEMTELMGMQYTKRGGVREWDEGKKEAT